MEFDVAIIGGGPAGYTAAETIAKAGRKVVLFEKNNVGGVCLNEGCIPTKTLLYAAKVYDGARYAAKYGIETGEVSFDLPKIISRKAKVVRKLTLGIKARLTQAGTTLITGEATIVDAHTVQCGDTRYACEQLIVCTGSETVVPPIPGLDEVAYWTHREALMNKEPVRSLVVVGGGVIGMEFASFFNSLGTEVTIIEMQDEILGGLDHELAALLRADYAKRGIRFLLSARVTEVSNHATEGICISYEQAGTVAEVKAEKVLLSVGRRPAEKGCGLENLPLARTPRGQIAVDEHLQTSVAGVYICGDLNGRSLLAHTAVRQAEVAAHHLMGNEDAMSYRAIPAVVYTNPEIASVGATEEALQREGITYRVLKLPMAQSGRFVAENEGVNGVCKALVSEDGTLLGMHLLGNPASELIVMAGMLIEDGRSIEAWKHYIFPHPTVAEVLREME